MLTLFVISWDANDPNEYVTKYRVYRQTVAGGSFALLKTVSSTSTRVEVPAGMTYCYKLKAVNVLGQVSPYSTTVCNTGV